MPGPPIDAPRRRTGPVQWVLRIAAALVLLAVAAVLFRNSLLRAGMEAAVTRATGFPLTVESFDLGLLDARMEIGGMRLGNPDGFEDPRCLHLPRVVAQVDAGSLRSEELRVKEIVLEVAEVVVVRNAAGEFNLDRLRAVGGAGEEGKEGAGRKPGEGAEPGAEKPGGKWRIDRLELTIRKVTYLDFSRLKDGKPRERTYDLGVDHEVFRDVDSPEAIVRIIALRVASATGLEFVNATVERLTSGLRGVAGVAGDAVQEGVKGLGDAVEGILGGKK